MATTEILGQPQEDAVSPLKERIKKSPMRSISRKLGKKSKKTKSPKGDENSRPTASSTKQASSSTASDVPTDDEMSDPGTPKLDISEIQENSLLNDLSLTPETAEDMENLVPLTPPQIHRLNDVDGVKGSKVATVTKADKSARLGITFRSSQKSSDIVIANIADDSLFADCVLKVGQKVVSINGKTCGTASDAVSLVQSTVGDLTIVTVDREDGKTPMKEINAKKLTNSLLESSFTGPDSTNAMLEAAYLKAQTENNEILRKMKDMEQKAAAEQREKVDRILRDATEGSALKWAKMAMKENNADSESVEESLKESILQPILDEPIVPSKKLDIEPKVEETAFLSEQEEKFDSPSAAWKIHVFRFVLITVVLLLCFTAIHRSSKYKDNIDHAIDDLKTLVSPRATACKMHLQKMHGDAAVFVRNEITKVDQFLAPAKSSLILCATSVAAQFHSILVQLSRNLGHALTKVKIILGLELDLRGEMVPMAQKYMGTDSDAPLSGMHVIIIKAASGVGLGLSKALSHLGATVVAVDTSAERLTFLKAQATSLVTVEVDLEDLASVSRAADSIVDSLGHVDLLINNAGGYYRGTRETEQGFDRYFGVNYLSQFLFTSKLLEPIKRSSKGTIVHVSSMTHALVDGSDLEIDSTQKQPHASVPGAIRNLGAYSNSLLAGILHNRYLSRTEKDLRVTRVFPRALTAPLRVRYVLSQILDDAGTDEEMAPTPLRELQVLLKHKLTPLGLFSSSAEDEDLQNDLYDWSQNVVSPYWWMDIVPQTREILREAGHEVIHPAGDGYGFFQGSVVTLLSISAYSIFRPFVTSRSSEA